MAHHLGDDKHLTEGHHSYNSRNGASGKSLKAATEDVKTVV
jgi:hypothetical protein